MKNNLPRKVRIAGYSYTVKVNRKSAESLCSFANRCITIGVKGVSRQEKHNSFIHEVLETIFEERNLRYDRTYSDSRPDNSDSLYVMSHDDLNIVVSDLISVLKKL